MELKQPIRPVRKYKINDHLLKMTRDEHNEAVKLLMILLDVSVNTIHGYTNILLSEKRDIPYNSVVKLERFFNVPPGSLFNGDIPALSFDQMRQAFPAGANEALKKKRNLVDSNSN